MEWEDGGWTGDGDDAVQGAEVGGQRFVVVGRVEEELRKALGGMGWGGGEAGTEGGLDGTEEGEEGWWEGVRGW